METNIVEVAVKASVAATPFASVLFCRPSLLAQFVWVSTALVCLTVVWLAVLNCRTFFRRGFAPHDVKVVRCRLAISQYMLLFFVVVWILPTAACAKFILQTMLATTEMGEMTKAMLYHTAEPPFTLAVIMVALTAIHAATGIVFEIRKRKSEGSEP